MVKTCKRGCCVYGFGGTLVLPNFWREPTQEEIDEETKARLQIKAIDLTTLYTT